MQTYLFCYHKVGTALLGNIMNKIARILDINVASIGGLASDVDNSKKIILFYHSLIDFDLSKHPHRGIRLIRDPRDIWLSGYLYHLHCDEGWCINTEFDLGLPILFPRVPYSQQYRTEEWKKNYILGLQGKSYQQNLNSMSREDGLYFEMERYADWTISAMDSWKPDPETIDIKIEDFMNDFDGTIKIILNHCGFEDDHITKILTVVATDDIGRMSDAQLASNPHIHSRSISKWQTQLTSVQIAAFEDRYKNVIQRLGYV